MSLRRHITKRVLFAAFALYLVLSITFGFVALTADPNIGFIAYQAARSPGQLNASERAERVEEAVSAYREARNLDEPVAQRYVRWMVDIATLDWGYSYSQRAPVMTVLKRAVPNTLAYVIPAMAFALVGGIGFGVYSALYQGTVFERLLAGGSYLGFGIPNYWLANAALLLISFEGAPPPGWGVFSRIVLPAAILGTGLLAGQLRYVRAESREYLFTEFVKLLRAKGASDWRIGRHILRNAALPLLSLFFVDLLGVLVVNVFVLEYVLGIHGLGDVGLTAIRERDMPLILGVALIIAITGVVGNLLQDLAYLVLDPRLDAD